VRWKEGIHTDCAGVQGGPQGALGTITTKNHVQTSTRDSGASHYGSIGGVQGGHGNLHTVAKQNREERLYVDLPGCYWELDKNYYSIS